MSLQPVSFKRPIQPKPRLSKPYQPGKRDERYWTDAELAVIREWYPKGGAPACMAHLPKHRGLSGVYAQANKLGLTAKAGGGPKVKVEAPEGFDDALRQFYINGDGKKRGECNAFADSCGLPRWWVTKRATRLGLVMPHRKEPPWTPAEEALMERVPLHDLDKSAEIFREHGFKRSPTAIGVKAKRLNLSRRATRTTLTSRAAAKIIGADDHFVTAAIFAGELKAVKRDDKRLPQQGGSAWDIEPADFRAFVLQFLERIDLRKVEKFSFVALIAAENTPTERTPT